MNFTEDEMLWMARAMELASRGEGHVEPNPMVGCVIVRDGAVIGEGFHQKYGEAHAEVNALKSAGERARGATMFVTLEPCCHQGKTPPCTDAVIAAGVKRVIAAMRDPFKSVNGGGFAALERAGITVESGLMHEDAARLNAPYLKLLAKKQPWVIAKWAMSLDGKIATHTGDSQWISCDESRRVVHELRGRVDAIMIGGGTAKRDNPLLTARPAGPKRALRIVLDSKAQLPSESQLATTLDDGPVLVIASKDARTREVERLRHTGCEVYVSEAETHNDRLVEVLYELGRRKITNLLVEGGSRVLGSLFEQSLIDEVWSFTSPKLIGGFVAPSPIAGQGLNLVAESPRFSEGEWRVLGSDAMFRGRISKE